MPQINKNLFDLIFHSIILQSIGPSKEMCWQNTHMSEIYYQAFGDIAPIYSIIFQL